MCASSLDLPAPPEGGEARLQNTPIFLGHGERDRKMKLEWGREMSDTLSEMGMDVSFKTYEELEHWFTSQELWDITVFLRGLWKRVEY